VLKPQLEGGAGNYYDEQISEKLKAFTPQQRAAHILMEKITPMVFKVGYWLSKLPATKSGEQQHQFRTT
jgi:hypothetical protein